MATPPHRMMYLTVEEVSVPRHNVVQVLKDCWWPTTEDGKVAIFLMNGKFERPQCNMHKTLADKVRAAPSLTGRVVQIPWAFVRWDD